MTDDEAAGQPQGPYVSADFMFGTLATDDLRLAQMRAASTGRAPRRTTSTRPIRDPGTPFGSQRPSAAASTPTT